MTALLLLAILAGLLLAIFFPLLARSQAATTFLVIGVDRRSQETGPARADVILLLHSDPARGQATLVSVPRDLWLPQPGGVVNRVNTALVTGHDPSQPQAAAQFLAQTLESNFGVDIDGHLMFGFGGFLRVVDAVGGIEVDVPKTIVDHTYPTADYGTQTIRFDAGPQHLDAEQALIYVRTRHQDSDFGRAGRQQQVLQALAGKMIRPQNWVRLPAVLLAVQETAQMDVGPGKIPALLLAGYYLAAGEVETVVLNEQYVDPWVTESGAHVLLPRWNAIKPMLNKFFGPVAVD